MTVNKEVLDQGSFAGAELLGLHQFIASGDAEVFGIFLIFLHQSLVVGVDKAEIELGAHLDEFKQFQFFVLGHDGGTQSHIVAAGGGDLGFKDLLTFQTFAQDLNGHVTVAVEFIAHTGFHLFTAFTALGIGFQTFEEVFIGNQLQNEFHTAVEVKSQTDGAGSLFAHQTHHVTVVLQIGAFHLFGQVDAFAVSSLKQSLRLIQLGIFGLQGFGILHQFQRLGIFFVCQQ